MTLKLLIVDDHSMMRSGLRRLLAAEGQPEGGERRGGDRQFRPDLVILDLNLPRISGLEVLGWLRVENPKARLLVISVYDNPIMLSAFSRPRAELCQ